MNAHWYGMTTYMYFAALTAVRLFVHRTEFFEFVFGACRWLRRPTWDWLAIPLVLLGLLFVLTVEMWILMESVFWPLSIIYWTVRGALEYRTQQREAIANEVQAQLSFA